MVSARCCPADCALREDWEDELNQVKKDLEDESVLRIEGILKAVSHPIRLKILLMLSNRDQCVCESIWVFDESPTQVSNHLKILNDAGIIETTGRTIKSTGSVRIQTKPSSLSSISYERRKPDNTRGNP